MGAPHLSTSVSECRKAGTLLIRPYTGMEPNSVAKKYHRRLQRWQGHLLDGISCIRARGALIFS